ncbi:MAG: hypothetical protein AAGE52_18930 [Myxococcota bacterium]
MGFRDEHEALRRRAEALEREKEALEERSRELEEENRALKAKLNELQEEAEDTESLDHEVRGREEDDRTEREANAASRKRRAERLAKAPNRVRVESQKGLVEIHIAPPPLWTVIRGQVDASFFFSIMPGAFVMVGIYFFFEERGVDTLLANVLALAAWIAIVGVFNVVVARFAHPPYRIRLEGRNLGVYRGDKAKVAGRKDKVAFVVASVDADEVGSVRFRDTQGHVEIDFLRDFELDAIRAEIGDGDPFAML